MAISVNDIIAVSFFGRISGQRMINTLHYRANDTSALATSTLMNNVITEVRAGGGGGDFLESAFLNCIGQNYTLQEIRAQKITTVRAKFESQARAVPGNVAVDCDAPNIAGVITKRGALAGRKYIGSLHMPGVPNGYYLEGDISGTYSTVLNSLATVLLGTIVAGTPAVNYFPVIYNRGSATPWTELSSLLVQTSLRTMRRRTVGLGE